MNKSDKRKAAEAILLKGAKEIDAVVSGNNFDRYKKLFDSMSNAKFDDYMQMIKEGKTVFYVYAPNTGKQYNQAGAVKFLENQGVKYTERILMYDTYTKKKVLSNEEYPIVYGPVRRQQQFQDKKMSVSESDTRSDHLTGQVAWDDKAARVTAPEARAIFAKELDPVLEEMMIRGGNVATYASEFKASAEATGEISIDGMGEGTVSRTAKIAEVFLKSLLIDNNLTEG